MFFNLVSFFPLLTGRFNNFELMQTEKKKKENQGMTLHVVTNLIDMI
jgi:hypothetical protein